MVVPAIMERVLAQADTVQIFRALIYPRVFLSDCTESIYAEAVLFLFRSVKR